MASNFLCSFCFLSCLLFFTSFFQTSSVNSVPLPSGTSDKVSVDIYYQSIGNAYLLSMYVLTTFEPEVFSIVDLHLVPWGNSILVNNETFICQGGEQECFLNTIQACAINAWPDVVKHLEFITCVEFSVYDNETSKWETCYEYLQFDRTPIDECYKSGLGKELEKKYAKETAALQPPHEYTPWVVVAGDPIHTDVKNIQKHICTAYKGSSLPEFCKHLPSNSEKVHKVSFRRTVAEAEATKFT